MVHHGTHGLHICNHVGYAKGMTASERDSRIPDLVSKAEAAEILGVSHQAVQQMVDKGRLRGAKIGTLGWVFRRAAVARLEARPNPDEACAAHDDAHLGKPCPDSTDLEP